MEVELKLLVHTDDVIQLDHLPLPGAVTVGPASVQHLNNVYFDTSDFDLWHAKASLRVRHQDARRIQTFKAGGGVSAGLHQREEWEMDLASDSPDIAALREAMGTTCPYRPIIASNKLLARLQPIFTSHITRTVRQLRLPTGDEIEMAIDQGTISYLDQRDSVSEIELELKSGVASRLYAFALALLELIPLRIGTLSKAERGYAMRLPHQKRVAKASKVRLSPSMTIEQAFETIVANCLEQVQGNEYGVMYGTDPENVHQMRVGLRRLRSALGLFHDVIACPADIQEDLRWIASQLGAARDWEVLARSTLDHLADTLPKDIRLDVLQNEALEQARENRERAADAVNSPRHTRLQLQLAHWLARQPWREATPASKATTGEMSLKKFANGVLKRGENRLLKRGKALEGDDIELRHRTRIAGKKARYTMEFFGSLYPRRQVKAYVARLSELQEALGWLNDASVGMARLEQLQHAYNDVAPSAAFARGYLFSQLSADHDKLMTLWKRFTEAHVPYKN